MQSDKIDSTQGGGVAVGDEEGGDVLHDLGATTDDGVITDAAELVDAGESGDDDVITDDDMSAEGCSIGEDAVIADDGVVRDMSVGEEVVIVSDDTGLEHGAAMNGDILAENIPAPDFHAGRLAGIFEILGAGPDGGVGVELVVLANLGVSFDCDMGMKVAALPQSHIGPDDAERPNFNVLSQMGFRRNDGGRMNHGGESGGGKRKSEG